MTVPISPPSATEDNFPRYLFPKESGSAKYWIVAGLALLAVAAFVGASILSGEPGFPLDDGWIHQTYARNFAINGQWSYGSERSSAGSTAPLWTLLLALGYLLRVPYLVWAFFLGWLCLTWIGWTGMRLFLILWPPYDKITWIVGVALVLSWPLIWAASSGMETLFFSALALQLLLSYGTQSIEGRWRPFQLGILSGLLVLIRPEGLGVLFLVLVGLLIAQGSTKRRLFRSGEYLFAVVLPLLPYLLLNLTGGGTPFPNTFYAKQAEYAFLWEEPIWRRYARLLYFTLGGPAEFALGMSGARLLLLPGFLMAGWLSVQSDWRQKRALHILPLLWVGGHVLAYAWRLPVTYQHGRYLFPILPVVIIYGIAGWAWIGDRAHSYLQSKGRSDFVLRTSARLIFAILSIIFLFLGLRVYAQDVAFINEEMVVIARWVEANTPEDALVAAHDIGALGYFAERPILDLAGLISPEVIPLLSEENEEELAGYVLQKGADYLVTAPGWPYLSLTESDDAARLFTTNYGWTQAQGFNNMAVYTLNP